MHTQTAQRERPAALRKRPGFWAALLTAAAGTFAVSWWTFGYLAHPSPQSRVLGIAIAAALGLLACSLVLRLALRRQRLAEARAELSNVDELTRRLRKKTAADESAGLKSRWEFYEALNIEIQRCSRFHHHFTTLFLKLESTDALSSTDKDHALSRLIEVLGQRTRTIDVLARYSDGTFAVLLPETERSGGEALVHRLGGDLGKILAQATSAHTQLALRFGLAVFPTEAAQAHTLIDAAEEELQRGDALSL